MAQVPCHSFLHPGLLTERASVCVCKTCTITKAKEDFVFYGRGDSFSKQGYQRAVRNTQMMSSPRVPGGREVEQQQSDGGLGPGDNLPGRIWWGQCGQTHSAEPQCLAKQQCALGHGHLPPLASSLHGCGSPVLLMVVFSTQPLASPQ